MVLESRVGVSQTKQLVTVAWFQSEVACIPSVENLPRQEQLIKNGCQASSMSDWMEFCESKINCCNLKMMFYEHIDTPKGTKCQQAKMGGGS